MAKGRIVRIQTTATNLLEYLDEFFGPAPNQRKFNAVGAGTFFAQILYLATLEADTKNTLNTSIDKLKGTIIGEGPCEEFILSSMSVSDTAKAMSSDEASIRTAIQNGQHRRLYFKYIFDDLIKVPKKHPLDEITGTICKKYGGLKFSELPKNIGDKISNYQIIVSYVESTDLGVHKVIFHHCNCGNPMKTNETMNNNYCDYALWNESVGYVESIFAKVSNPRYGIKKEYAQMMSTFSKTAIQNLITRVLSLEMLPNESWTTAKNIAHRTYGHSKGMSTNVALSKIKKVNKALQFAFSVSGEIRQPIHIYSGLALYYLENHPRTSINSYDFQKLLNKKMDGHTDYYVQSGHQKSRTLSARNMVEEIFVEMGVHYGKE